VDVNVKRLLVNDCVGFIYFKMKMERLLTNPNNLLSFHSLSNLSFPDIHHFLNPAICNPTCTSACFELPINAVNTLPDPIKRGPNLKEIPALKSVRLL